MLPLWAGPPFAFPDRIGAVYQPVSPDLRADSISESATGWCASVPGGRHGYPLPMAGAYLSLVIGVFLGPLPP